MKERPIRVTGPMVRAILGGSKTQTRRIVKDQPPMDCGFVSTAFFNSTVIDQKGLEQPRHEIFGAYSKDGSWGLKCPYGAPGDHLWVRETWQHSNHPLGPYERLRRVLLRRLSRRPARR